MYIHEEILRQAIKSLKEYDSTKGVKLNKYIGLLELAKVCGEAIIPLKKYTIESSKLTDSLNHTLTIVPSKHSTSEGIIEVTFGAKWHEDAVRLFLKSQPPPLFQLAAICLREAPIENNTAESVVSEFIKTYNLPEKRDEKVSATTEIKTSDKPVSSQRFIEICEEVFGNRVNSKIQSYTPSAFAVSSAGEIDRGPFTQPLLNQAEIFNIIKMVRVKEHSMQETDTTPPSDRKSFNSPIHYRLICALASKPFAILAGGTGTGKTKSAIEVARRICRKQLDGNPADYEVVAVGADWTDTRPLLGYENILGATPTYTVPKALELIIRASRNREHPYFLILDEMNLSHVERYFSDFLSLMEVNKVDKVASTIKLHSNPDGMPSTDGNVGGKVEQSIPWPDNLFVIGTVNIDETTHMFSPKVLDRAHVIEFKPDEEAVSQGLSERWQKTSLSDAAEKQRQDKEAGMWSNELVGSLCGIDKKAKLSELIFRTDENVRESLKQRIMSAWKLLNKSRFSFSHRTAQETAEFVFISRMLSEKHSEILSPALSWDQLIDIAFLQKVLPKINGSAETLTVEDMKAGQEDTPKNISLLEALIEEFQKEPELKLCVIKLKEMQRTLDREHFVSFIQ